MEKKNTKKERTIMQVIRILSRRLEHSKENVFNELVPDLIEVDVYSKQKSKSKHSQRRPFDNYDENEPKLSKKELDEIVADLNTLAEYLKCTPVQAALFVACFTCNISCDNFDTDDIARFFDLPQIDFIILGNDLDALRQKLLTEAYESPFNTDSQCITHAVKQAIYANEPIPEQKPKEYTRYVFAQEIAHYVENRTEDHKSTRTLKMEVERAENKAMQLEFVRKVLEFKLDTETRTLLYDICNDFIASRNHSSNLDYTLKDIYDDIEQRFSVAAQLMKSKHILQELDLVDIQAATMLSDAQIFLTEKGVKLFLEKDHQIFTKKGNGEKLISPKSIADKDMFYDEELKSQLDFFEETLQEKKFKALQKRLATKAMPKGMVALFYGLPGTGKTETVKQIAKHTGRSIYHVDISTAKTCWYGESQKLVKRIFTDYAEMCKNEKTKPILLFNEADALFSSRHDTGRNSGASSTDQTENAIQNIILEEMEKLDGIMIATSNLANNLDPAFDRRFLFKIEFGQPSLEAKKAIWRSKIEWLNDEECTQLASKYDFSGGEIDNVARKATMKELLRGEKPTMEELDNMCKHEKIGDKNKSIGFKN